MTDRPDSLSSPDYNPAEELINTDNNHNEINRDAELVINRSNISSTTPQSVTNKSINKLPSKKKPRRLQLTQSQVILLALVAVGLGLWFDLAWLGISGAVVSLLFSLEIVLGSVKDWILKFLTPQERRNIFGFLGFLIAIAALLKYIGVYNIISGWLNQFKYDEFGSWADWVGALGQISIAILAVYVAWAQYVISKDLTIQQNRITQQQTIDAYFQGISDLTLNEEGLLEDWPQERAIAEGRTAAILSSVDKTGKAKIIRFLSQSRLLTPLQRDSRLGRPMLDGSGGYAEDRPYGTRVIDLGVMLAGADLSDQDLRWTDMSEANLVRTNLYRSDLVKANLARTILYEGNLGDADLKSTKLFYGLPKTATPRTRKGIPNYETGENTGVVIERANFSGVKRLSDEQRYYLCAWCGEKGRDRIPGGCEGIPNKLGR
ncbi:putative low-complexity protein [Hyella patelloides LEGE 07179]|uniref:Putative low-complexity protein n=1 Tax=Hyella patelloides LEGE 07179 TaxID=945734 RepID=A0A563VQE3_9CYAN|nr:pentapeptide repeat-containing protein [Hyella patelloides]VEP13614.1 putative low-complexity protein [Hyella patelloides LEGE 07179]